MLCSDIKICYDINLLAINALIMTLITMMMTMMMTTMLHCFCVLSGENHSMGYLWWERAQTNHSKHKRM